MEKRLAYLCGSDSWGGLEMNHLRNAEWMQARGHKVLILAWDNSPLALEAAKNSVPLVIIDRYKKYFDFSAQARLVKVVKEYKITHLLIRATRDMSLASGVKQRLGKKLHISYFMEMQLGIKKDDLLHTFRFRQFDLWACPLEYLVQQVKTMTRFSSGKVKHIPSGIDFEYFQGKADSQTARKNLNLPSDKILVGLIGRFDCQKGQNLLLEAYHRASRLEDLSKMNICFLGEPTRNESDNYFQRLKDFIRNHEMEDRVFIRPFMDNPADFYTAMDWIVMASKAETFGMVTLEALASGKPVLGSDRGGTPELLGDGEFGILFQSMDEYDLSRKLTDIAQEQQSFDAEKLKARAHEFDYKRVCELVEENLGL